MAGSKPSMLWFWQRQSAARHNPNDPEKVAARTVPGSISTDAWRGTRLRGYNISKVKEQEKRDVKLRDSSGSFRSQEKIVGTNEGQIEERSCFRWACTHAFPDLAEICPSDIQKYVFVSIKGLPIHHPIKLHCFWLQQQHSSQLVQHLFWGCVPLSIVSSCMWSLCLYTRHQRVTGWFCRCGLPGQRTADFWFSLFYQSSVPCLWRLGALDGSLLQENFRKD